MDLNRATLLGHVVHSPKSRTLPSGDTIARFSLATNFASRDPQTKVTKQGVEYHEVTAFGPLADVVLKHVGGGMQLYVEGRLHNREYVGRGGVKLRTTEIVLSQLVMMGTKRTKGSPASEVPAAEARETT